MLSGQRAVGLWSCVVWLNEQLVFGLVLSVSWIKGTVGLVLSGLNEQLVFGLVLSGQRNNWSLV